MASIIIPAPAIASGNSGDGLTVGVGDVVGITVGEAEGVADGVGVGVGVGVFEVLF